jgi:hypothetical protein
VTFDYDKFAKKYDLLDDGAVARSLGFPGLRTALLSRAKGSVLETGIGTGARQPTPGFKFTRNYNTFYAYESGKLMSRIGILKGQAVERAVASSRVSSLVVVYLRASKY